MFLIVVIQLHGSLSFPVFCLIQRVSTQTFKPFYKGFKYGLLK